MNLRAALEKYLKEMNMTQAEFASKSGVPQSVLSKFLSGKQPSLNSTTIEKIWPYIYGKEIDFNESENE